MELSHRLKRYPTMLEVITAPRQRGEHSTSRASTEDARIEDVTMPVAKAKDPSWRSKDTDMQLVRTGRRNHSGLLVLKQVTNHVGHSLLAVASFLPFGLVVKAYYDTLS